MEPMSESKSTRIERMPEVEPTLDATAPTPFMAIVLIGSHFGANPFIYLKVPLPFLTLATVPFTIHLIPSISLLRSSLTSIPKLRELSSSPKVEISPSSL